ncbi:MAG: dipeptide epimerase [Pseudomonadota bacterium]
MAFRIDTIELVRRHPLIIARGRKGNQRNLFLRLEHQGEVGLGEIAPNVVAGNDSAADCERQLRAFLEEHTPTSDRPENTWSAAREAGLAPCVIAGLDVALWDLRARRAGQPLYRLLKLQRRSVPTSVTLSLMPPNAVSERLRELLARTGARQLKVKLGSPDGPEADRAIMRAVWALPETRHLGIKVDANGGWSLREARTMMRWLAERSVVLVEQPLAQGCEEQLTDLFRDRPLPLFVDESCAFSTDIPPIAEAVDGVNLKLQRCGGVTEALRFAATARQHALDLMIGCLCESSVSISTAASLASLANHVDLDAHLNLVNDPATGPGFNDGVVLPAEAAGHGARLR